MVKLEDLKREAKHLLDQGKVKYIIGYKKSSHGFSAAPLFLKTSEEVDNLVWDPTCVHNLTRFLDDEKKKKARQKEPDNRPVGIFVKGCDSRAINVLLQEEFIKREDVYILGISCENTGVVDEKKVADKTKGKKIERIEFSDNNNFDIFTDDGKIEMPARDVLAERCIECKINSPVIKDILFGENIVRNVTVRYKSIAGIEALNGEERWTFWKEHLDRCIRCYACRSICPMCYCDECVVDTINFAITANTGPDEKAQKIKWIEKSPITSENFVYHMVRAIHLAGRCVDCGECERVCPMDIPLRFLNKKMEKEAKEMFDYEVGLTPDQPSLVSSFKDEDPEDFIR